MKKFILVVMCTVLAAGCIGQKSSMQSATMSDKYAYNFGWKVKCSMDTGGSRYIKLPDNFFNMNPSQFDTWFYQQNLADSEYNLLRHNTFITQGNVYKSGCLEGAC